MHNKRKITAIFLIPVIVFSAGMITAHSITAKRNRDNFIRELMSKSPEYQIINKSIEKNILSGYDSESNIEDIDRQIAQTDTIEVYSLKIVKAQYEMQDKLNKLYEKYSPDIKEQEEDSFKYQTSQKLNNVKLNERRIAYLDSCVALKEKELEVGKARFDTGYSTQTDVDMLSAELASLGAERDVLQTETDTLLFGLKQNISSGSITFEHDYAETKPVDYKKVLSLFKEKDFLAEYSKEEIKIYEEYTDELAEIEEEISPFLTNPGLDSEVYDFFSRISEKIEAETKLYENEIEIKKLSTKQYGQQLELYVYNLCGTHNSLLSQIEAKEKEIAAVKSQAQISGILLEEGRITPVDAMTADVNTEKLELDRFQLLIQLDGYKYLLDNCIFNE